MYVELQARKKLTKFETYPFQGDQIVRIFAPWEIPTVNVMY
jgi:hypothetical protein